MKPILFLFILSIAACGERPVDVDYGKTTVADLKAEKGEPLSEKSVPVKENRILQFENDEKYQVKGEIVTHGFKNPKGEQKTVLFWKHKFKNCDTTLTKLPYNKKSHTPPEYELACPSEGKSVIYSEGSEFVTRVIEYEKK